MPVFSQIQQTGHPRHKNRISITQLLELSSPNKLFLTMDQNSNGGRKYSTHTIRSILGLKDDTATTDSLHNDDKSTSINTSIKTNGVITPTINVPDLTKDRLNDQSIDQLKIRLVETRGIPYPKYVTDTLKNWFTKNMAHPSG